MIGSSAAFARVVQQIRRVAAYQAPVLIEGETGTGKDLAAREIHYGGSRRDRPFVPVNCGALPDNLIENELFGHRRGAFTDARDDQPGLVALAHSGTLFLDEVDALSPRAQVSLLRFLQDQKYRPVGGRREEHVDVRIIAASNRVLEDLVKSGAFRADLLYRLTLMQLRLPPLRERGEDIELLTDHFLAVGSGRFSCPRRRVGRETLSWFSRYAWPGNVRELEHLVYQGLLLSEGSEIAITPPRAFTERKHDAEGSLNSYRRAKEEALEAFERSYLTRLIEQAKGNVSVAARMARTERRHLGRLLKKHQLCKGRPQME